LASVELNNSIRLWDSLSDDHLIVLRPLDPSVNFYYRLAWSPDRRRLASGTYRRGMHVFDMATQQLLWAGGAFPVFIQHIVWGSDGAWLAGSGDDGAIYILDATDGRLIQRLAAHHSMIASITVSPAAPRLIAAGGGAAGGLCVWDVQSGERMHTIVGQAESIGAVAWGVGAATVISGGGDGTLRWWDLQRNECLLMREAHAGAVEALKRSPDGTKPASCDDDGAIMIWDLSSGERLQTLRRDRPYERMSITGLTGISAAQHSALLALGAGEQSLQIH
jgi:WD40 repeat protein